MPGSRHVIDVAQGRATVYLNGELRGETPLEFEARPRETVSLELRQPGYATLRERFDVTTRRTWTFTMRALSERTREP